MTSKRSARLTWVNFEDPFPNTLAANTRIALDLLASAENFQKFDSTIVKVIGTIDITHVALGAVSSEDFQDMAYLYVADENLALANFPLQEDPTVQPSYLYTAFAAGRRVGNSGAGGVADPSLHLSFNLNVNAMRRFRENNKTLWLVLTNLSTTGEGFLWASYIRTLIRTP